MNAPSWQPILTGELRERALTSIDEITREVSDFGRLDSKDPPSARAALPGGFSGLSLFFGYLSKVRSDPEHARMAAGMLERAVEIVATCDMPPSLHGGFVGVAWAGQHLQANVFDDEDDVAAEIDDALLSMLSVTPWPGDYDLVLGLVGFAVYALERIPRPRARQCLELVVERLAELSEKTRDGITWITRPELLGPAQREQYPDGLYNLGAAHGVPGVIAVLAQAHALGIAPETSARLLDGAVSWLLKQEVDDPRYCFGYVAGETTPVPSRCAWCYGDPGVAAILLIAANATNNDNWRAHAVRIGLTAARRTSVEQAGVSDAGLCHGSAGLGHLFNRMFQGSGEEQFLTTARGWLQCTLDLRGKDAIAGYPAYVPLQDGWGYEPDPGFLGGAAGVGMALLAATTDVDPQWDRTLLLSAAPLKPS